MKKYIKILIIAISMELAIIAFGYLKSNAAELWWPIGSNDLSKDTYYVDSNGNKLENIEINEQNDKKYKKMATGTENETDIEYYWNRRSYSVNNNTDPYEKSFYSKNEPHFGVDIRSLVQNGNNTQSKTNYHNVIAASDGEVIATSADRITSAGISFEDRNRRRLSSDGGGYGNYILLKTTITNNETGKDEEVVLMYAHLYKNSLLVKKGDKVVTRSSYSKNGK